MPTEIQELQEKQQKLRGDLGKIFEEAKAKDDSGKTQYDFRQVKCLDSEKDMTGLEGSAKSIRIAEVVQQKNAELDEVSRSVEALMKAVEAGDQLEKARNTPANPPRHPDGGHTVKSMGQQVVGSEIYKKWAEGGSNDGQIEIAEYGLKELKTLFQTTDGWPPESTRTGVVVDAVTRPIQVLDIVPSGQTGQAAIVYMEETTRTHNAAEKGEGVAYAESEFDLAEKTSTVRKITDSVPVTDEQLEDVAMVESYLDGRLQFGIRQRLDNQILNGGGTGADLEGILNNSDLQTQAKGTDPVPDAVYKAMTKVRVTGRAFPTHFITHPNDWQQVRLLRTADGIYIWGSPAEAGPERIWGLPVIQADSLAEGTGLVGSFMSAWITAFERRGVVVERGFVNDDFTKGKKTIRASMRVALAIYRGAAFSSVTGI